MAKLMLIGETAHVVLDTDPEDGQIIATCAGHVRPNPLDHRLVAGCQWSEQYDTLNDAAEYAADHADGRYRFQGKSGLGRAYPLDYIEEV